MTERIPCSAPDCAVTFQSDLAPAALTILLEIHARTAHPPTAAPQVNTPSTKAEKVRRPTIAAAGSSEEWLYFCQRWSEYKAATKLTRDDIVYQLLECTEEALRRDINRAYGTITNETEEEALRLIKLFAVKAENVLVNRVQLQNIQQDRDETVRSFSAKLKGQAAVCGFTKSKQCTCGREVSIDYSSEMVRDTLIRGLADEDIRQDIVSQARQDMVLDEVIQLAEAKESGKRSVSRLNTVPTVTTNAASNYRKYNKNPHNQRPQQRSGYNNYGPPSQSQFCSHCGLSGHGNGRNKEERVKKCPAYNKRCTKCGLLHHSPTVCRKQVESSSSNQFGRASQQPATQDAVFLHTGEEDIGFFHESPYDEVSSITLDHHVYDDMVKAWLKRKSDPQPFIRLAVTIDPTDLKDLGYSLPIKSPTVSYVNAIADTGCQSCLAGSQVLQTLNISKSSLVPVKMQMTAANSNAINIIGALPLCFTGTSPSGIEHTTRQIVYFTDSTNKLFISKQACTMLGIISRNFPTIGETLSSSDKVSAEPESGIIRSCDCPRRQLPPPKPTSLPYPPTEENRLKLEKWLLNYYKSSTFNICEHQILPMMKGPPLHLMIQDDATPYAVHKPIPIPVHWQEDVYAGLEQDVGHTQEVRKTSQNS